MVIQGLEIKGIKESAEFSEMAEPYRAYIQIDLDLDTGELWTAYHISINNWTVWQGNMLNIAFTDVPLTENDIIDRIGFYLAEHQEKVEGYKAMEEYYGEE